jgi:hypothetical protein
MNKAGVREMVERPGEKSTGVAALLSGLGPPQRRDPRRHGPMPCEQLVDPALDRR